MRFMMIVRANRDSEAGKLPSAELIAHMGKFNEEMAQAGVMLAGEGLQASAKGARVSFRGGAPQVVEGPFPPEELIGGFWIIRVDSKEQAIAWAKRVPFDEGVIEIRQVFEAEDFGDRLTPEARGAEARLRDRLAGRS